MKKQKTALQQAIENLEGTLKECENLANKDNSNKLLGEHGVGYICGVIMILKQLLPIEKQQMEEAWIKGMSSHPNNEKAQFNDFDDYYKETYETE